MCIECNPDTPPAGREAAIRAWRRAKGMLTRAEKSDDLRYRLKVAGDVEDVFNEYGWPDWWSRQQRLLLDTLDAIHREHW